MISDATKQWIRSENDELAVREGCWFDEKRAEKVCQFFEEVLCITGGQTSKLELIAWQRDDVLMPLYGWRRENGNRRYNKGDIWIAKKNGKSFLLSGLANYTLASHGNRAEVYGVAHSREQAKVIYDEAAAMVRTSPVLSKRFDPIDSQNRIVFKQKMSFYKSLAGENGVRSAEGIKPAIILFDEIHVQRDRALYDALAYAMINKPDGLMLSVSTVGVADETTIWWEQYIYSKGIIDGTIKDPYRFAYLAQADEECKTDADLRMDPEQWKKANPSLGVTVLPEKIKDAVVEAENSPAKLNNLLRYVFNIPTAQVARVVPIESWKRSKANEPDLIGRRCFGGLDMASHEDISSFVLYFPVDGEQKAFCKAWFWCPEERIRQRELKQQAFYRVWVDEGWLIQTEGNRIDPVPIEETIRKAFDDYRIEELGFDPWNADAVVNPLVNEGFPLVQVMQTLAGMSSGTQGVLDEIAEEKLQHDGNPVMTWCLGNCAANTRADAIKFDKDKSADKIDGAVSLAIAKGRHLSSPGEYESFYDNNEVELI